MNKTLYSILILSFLLNYGCKHKVEMEATNQPTFNHVYSFESDEKCYSISLTDDNGYLLIGSEGGNELYDECTVTLMKTDEYGTLQWKNKIVGDSFYIPFITQQGDGSFLICPSYLGRKMYKVNKNGIILFASRFDVQTYYDNFSYPLQRDNGQYIFTSNSYSFNSDRFIHFDINGKFTRYSNIKLPSIVTAADYICMYKTEDSSTYYYYGIQRYNNISIAKIFVAKQTYSGNVLKTSKSILVDDKNTSDKDFPSNLEVPLKHIILPNNNLLLYDTRQDATGIYKGYIAVIDNSINKLWDLDLKIKPQGTIINSIHKCPDDNFLVMGACKSSDNKLNQPFACKMDVNGNLLWTKIFTTNYSGAFNSGFQLADGSYVFGGTTNGFGSGKNLNDIFILKTDSMGNLK